MANQWFKFYGAEYLSDPKMDRLSVQERSCWLTLLCMASQTNGLVKYISVEGLLNKSGVRFNPYDTTEWDNAQNVLKTFEQYEMILISKNGSVEIVNWEKRQETAMTVAERQAKYRENKKSNEKVTGRVTKVTLEENRIEESRVEDNRIDIYTHIGEFENVKLSSEELQKLKEKLGEHNTEILIEELSGYIASTKKKYSNHYATLLNWARRKYQEKQNKSANKTKTITVIQ